MYVYNPLSCAWHLERTECHVKLVKPPHRKKSHLTRNMKATWKKKCNFTENKFQTDNPLYSTEKMQLHWNRYSRRIYNLLYKICVFKEEIKLFELDYVNMENLTHHWYRV